MAPHSESFSGVKSVLVVLSSKALAYDPSGLRNLITHAYPGSAVFFITVSGDPLGMMAPSKVDLVIDFTEPSARQTIFFAPKMRSRGKYVVGRNRGWFYRKSNYDRVYDQKGDRSAPTDYLENEQWSQRKVLELSGVPVVRQGGLTQDLSSEIAQSLPPLRNR